MIVDRASAIAYKAGRHEAVARLPALGYCRADRDQRQVRAAYRRTRSVTPTSGRRARRSWWEPRHAGSDRGSARPRGHARRTIDGPRRSAARCSRRRCHGAATGVLQCAPRSCARDRAVVLERCGQAALETGVQLVTARGVEREARRPGTPQAVDQGELAATHEVVHSWELEQAHVPALLPLLRVGERAYEGGRVRNR